MLTTPRATPVDRARDFQLRDLFFSTTDKKGIITGCNDVFVSIANFTPEELLGKPHNIIRHPDMPRCIFQLLWNYLLAGKPIGAYVKNIAKTGEHYWVFALLMPIDGGFLSIRIKPGSPIFATVQGLYKKLLSIEHKQQKNWRQGMEEASLALNQAIEGLGFSSYDSFMAIALKAEIEARREGLAETQNMNTPLDKVISDLSSVEKLQEVLAAKHNFFGLLGKQISIIALNARIAAAKLAEAGRALGVISEEVSQVAAKIREESAVLSKETTTLTGRLYDTLFKISFCVLIREMISCLEKSALLTPSPEEQIARSGDLVDNQILMLTSLYSASLEECNINTSTLLRALDRTQSFNESLSRALLNLQLGYIIGKSTSASLSNGKQFTLLLEDMLSVSQQSQAELREIKDVASTVREIVVGWSSKRVFAEK